MYGTHICIRMHRGISKLLLELLAALVEPREPVQLLLARARVSGFGFRCSMSGFDIRCVVSIFGLRYSMFGFNIRCSVSIFRFPYSASSSLSSLRRSMNPANCLEGLDH